MNKSIQKWLATNKVQPLANSAYQRTSVVVHDPRTETTTAYPSLWYAFCMLFNNGKFCDEADPFGKSHHAKAHRAFRKQLKTEGQLTYKAEGQVFEFVNIPCVGK